MRNINKKANGNFISGIVLIGLVIALIFLVSQNSENKKTNVYYDFNDFDTLDLTGVEVLENENEEYNSLVINSDYVNSDGEINLLTNFNESLENGTNFVLEYQLDITETRNSQIYLGTSMNGRFLDDGLHLTMNNAGDSFGLALEGSDILNLKSHNDALFPDHKRVYNNVGNKSKIKVTYDFREDVGYVIGSYDIITDNEIIYKQSFVKSKSEVLYQELANNNLMFKLGSILELEYDPLKDRESFVPVFTQINENDKLILDYIKLSY